jgi:acyl dehydratase
MGLNFDLVGKPQPATEHSYTSRDTILYALGVGAKTLSELSYLYEGDGPLVLPSFAVVPSFKALTDALVAARCDFKKVLHGEQTIVLHQPIPPSGTLKTVATVTGIYDKGKGALVVVESKTRDASGNPLFDNISSIFVRGEGGFGGDRGPESKPPAVPEGEPTFKHTEITTTEQAALYRLSGDLNPLHIQPAFAKAAGFERPILHGLCTYGYAVRAVLAHACERDPKRLRRFFARFTGVVYPGDTLTTSGWKVDGDSYLVQVKTQDGRAVLDQALAHVQPH